MYREFLRSCIDYIWIGARDDAKDGTWRWRSDASVAAVYTRRVGGFKFEKGEPNNVGNNEHCVQLVHAKKALFDKNCDENTFVICQGTGILLSQLLFATLSKWIIT